MLVASFDDVLCSVLGEVKLLAIDLLVVACGGLPFMG